MGAPSQLRPGVAGIRAALRKLSSAPRPLYPSRRGGAARHRAAQARRFRRRRARSHRATLLPGPPSISRSPPPKRPHTTIAPGPPAGSACAPASAAAAATSGGVASPRRRIDPRASTGLHHHAAAACGVSSTVQSVGRGADIDRVERPGPFSTPAGGLTPGPGNISGKSSVRRTPHHASTGSSTTIFTRHRQGRWL